MQVYSLTLTNVIMTNGLSVLYMGHGTSYNVSVIIDNVNIVSTANYGTFRDSLFSLYFTINSNDGYHLDFYRHSQQSQYCDTEGVESQSTIVIDDSQFYNNTDDGILFDINRDYFQLSNHYIAITIKSCSSHDNDYGLFINRHLTHISVIDTELNGNWRNEIVGCLFIIINDVTITNSLSTGLVNSLCSNCRK